MSTVKKIIGSVPMPKEYTPGMTLYKYNIVTVDNTAYIVTAESTTSAPSASSPDYRVFTGLPMERVIELEGTVTTMGENIEELESSLADLTGRVDANAESIASILDTIGDGEGEGTLTSRIAIVEGAIENQGGILTAATSAIQEHEEDISSLSGLVETQGESIESILGVIGSDDDGGGTLISRIAAAETAIAGHGESIAATNDAVQQQAEAIAENTQAIAETAQAITETAQAITENAQAIANNTEAITNNTQAIAENTQAITNANTAIATNAEGVESLSSRVGSIEEQLADGVGSVQGITLNGVPVEPDSDKVVHLTIEQQQADDTLDANSTNPIQNKVVANEVSQLKSKALADVEVEEGDGVIIMNFVNENGVSIAEAELPQLGGGGGEDLSGTIRLVVSASVDKSVIREGEAVELTYSYDSVYASGDDAGVSAGVTATITVEARRGGTVVSSTSVANVGKGTYKMQIGDILAAGANDIYVIAKANDPETGKQKKKQAWVQVYVSALALHSTYSLTDTVRNGGVTSSVTIPYTITGTGNKTVQLYVDGVMTQTQTQNMSGTRAGEFVVPLGAGYGAGRHTIQMVAYATVAGVELTSNSVLIDVLKAGGSTPWVGVKFERPDGMIFAANANPGLMVGQYEQLSLQFAAYDPAHEDAAVEIKLDGSILQAYNVERRQQDFSTRFTAQGDHSLTFAVAGATAGNGIRTLGIAVSESSLGVGIATQGMKYQLNAEGRSNAETNPAQWGNSLEDGDTVTTSFENVDWSSSGWTGNSLKLINGAKAIVGIKPFNTDVSATGLTLEIICKVDNVADAAASLISCVDGGKGLNVTSSRITYQTGQTVDYTNEDGVQTTRAVGLETKYDNGGWMRVALVISARMTEPLMELYVDGDRVKADTYADTFSFRQTSPKEITFDSTGADIEIRRIRVYNRALSDDEVLDNTIVEQDAASEMLSMWQKNNVLGEGAEVSMAKLRSQDKSVLLIVRPNYLNDVYETNNKKEDFAADVHFYPGASARAVGAKEFHLTGCYIRIQGTSSTKYPAKNIRIYLNKGVDGMTCEVGGEILTGSARKYALRSTTPAQSVLCAKKDYSDSSMSTNTGGAKIFNNVMVALDLLTPPQRYQKDNGKTITARAAIDGYPVDMFSAETLEGEARYYGQYNLNNEKSKSGDVFGMSDIAGATAWPCPIALESLNNTESACLFAPVGDVSSWLASKFDDGMEINFSRQGSDGDIGWAKLGTTEKTALVNLYTWIAACKPAGANSDNISTWVSSKFKNEVAQHFDVDYLLTYYLIINYFMGVDQLAKNILWRTWDGAKWYPTYYDGDTQWGKRNDSFLVYDYNITRNSWDAQASKYAFEGHDSWLWNMCLANLAEEMAECADALRQEMTNTVISDMLLVEQAGHWPERIFNKSGRIAYIDPALYVTYGRKWPFIYAGQGRNSPHRAYMIKNRTAIMDATYICGDYRKDNIDLYLSQTASQVSSFKVTATEDYSFGYGTTNKPFMGTTGIVTPEDEPTLMITGQFTVNDPLRIYGASRIDKFDGRGMSGTLKNGLDFSKCVRMRELNLSVPADGSVASTNWFFKIDSCRQLRKLNLNGQTEASTDSIDSGIIDLTNQNRLWWLDARGVNVQGILFARGGSLSEVYFPNGIQVLRLDYLPQLENTGISLPDVSNIRVFSVQGCTKMADSRQLTMRWINGKNAADAQCTLTLVDIEWKNVPVSDAVRLARLVIAIKGTGAEQDDYRVNGRIELNAAPTAEQALLLIEAFGTDCFSSVGRLHITAPGNFIIAAPESVAEGASAENALIVRVVALQEMTGLSITATPNGTGVSTQVDLENMFVKIWSQEQGGDRSVTITAKGTPSDGMQKTSTATVAIVPKVYPSAFTVEGSTRLLPGQTYTFELVPDDTDGVNGVWQTAWSVSGEGSEQVTLSQQSRGSVRVSVAADADIGEAVVKATVTRAAGSDVPIGKPTATGYIMTSEMLMTKYSNGPLLAIAKAQGWVESNATYMTFDEAAEVDSLPAITDNADIVSLDELWYFTGVKSFFDLGKCSNLKSVRLPQNLTGGRYGSFIWQCPNLEFVEVPAGVTGLSSSGGSNVFNSCPKLKTMIFHGMTAPVLDGYVFYSGIPNNGTIYVPVGATGYGQGLWKSKLIDSRGWTIKYTL